MVDTVPPPTSPATPANPATGLAALSTEHFWWIFVALFLLFCLPAGLAIFIQLDGARLGSNDKLSGLVLFIHSHDVTYIAKYGSFFLLPLSAYATLTNASSVENRRKGFTLFNIFFVLLLVCLVFYALTWVLKLDHIVGYPSDDPGNPVPALAVIRPTWETYIEVRMLNVATLLGISTTQKAG